MFPLSDQSKKECLAEAKNALKSAEDSDDDGYDMKAALKVSKALQYAGLDLALEQSFPRTAR